MVDPTGIKIKVEKNGGRLIATHPVRIRNSVRTDLTDISQIFNVVETDKSDGAMVLWNASKNRYEVKPVANGSTSNYDGGTF